VAEKPQINQGNQIIAELEADLDRAYQVISQQQEYINKLQEKLSQDRQESLQTDISLQHNAVNPAEKTRPQDQGAKRILSAKTSTSKLSPIQFTSLVAIIVVLITFLGFALTRRQNPNSSKQTTTQSNTTPKSQASLPSLPILPDLPQTISPPNISPPIGQINSELIYNVKTAPNFRKSPALQSIVDEVVNLATTTALPTKPLSITLINVKTGEYAEYQQAKPRFPASVVKMFWMVYLYAEIQNGIWNEADFMPYLNDMIKKSDNNAASTILDAITQTESGKSLAGKDYDNWLKNRKGVNRFFQKAGYEKINVSQKTFPITNKKIYEPQGADLKMRGNPIDPIRNKITTQQAARLLYEIYEGQAISQIYSQKMSNWLSIDPASRIEKREQQNPDQFNPVRGYFSQSLPTNVYFGGKAGWTSNSRQEAAYIATPDGKAAYILVVFAEDRAYAYNWKIFPKISNLVFERLTNSN